MLISDIHSGKHRLLQPDDLRPGVSHPHWSLRFASSVSQLNAAMRTETGPHLAFVPSRLRCEKLTG